MAGSEGKVKDREDQKYAMFVASGVSSSNDTFSLGIEVSQTSSTVSCTADHQLLHLGLHVGALRPVMRAHQSLFEMI